MKRRAFLKYLASSTAAKASFLGGTSYLSVMREVFAANGKTLIVIFQRGGCDGLNTVVPYGEDEYYSLRPDIAISGPSSSKNSALEIDNFFGLHPSLSPFVDIYQRGDMAIFPAVHYPNATRSHFSGQDFIESGVTNKRILEGWLNRHLASFNQSSQFRAISFGELAHSLRGDAEVITLDNLLEAQSNYFSESLTNQLDSIFKQQVLNNQSNKKLINHHGSILLNNLNRFSSLSYENYSPSNGAEYPDNEYGQQLRTIAYLIKSNLGLEIGSVDHHGWDDHANQGGAEGAHANRLSDFSSGIAALYKDLGTQYMNDVVILTMTEFGRTAKQNASNGTDHGNASNWFAISSAVNGGIYGDWPGLNPEDLYLSRYLRHTIDFRDIFSEIIKTHLGNISNLEKVIPEHQYNPIGFI